MNNYEAEVGVEENNVMWARSPPVLVLCAVPIVWLIVASFANWVSSIVVHRRRWRELGGRALVHDEHEEKVSEKLPTPLAAPVVGRYGLALGETQEPSLDADEDELTMDEIRRLQMTNAFRVYCKLRGITPKDLESIEQRLQTYRRLRTLHPPSLLMMCDHRSLVAWETRDPGVVFRSLEYIITTILHTSLVLTAALYLLVSIDTTEVDHRAFPLVLLCLLLFFFLVLVPSLYSRPSIFGTFFSAWYVDLDFEHKASAYRCILAILLEIVYVVATFGIGGFVSLMWRCSGLQQSMGERIAGVRIVKESKKVWRPTSGGG
jgi:hypothetical protein